MTPSLPAPACRSILRAAAVAGFLFAVADSLHANPPAASFIFPAGGQRGTTVKVRVGGLFLHKSCNFAMTGPGIDASRQLARMKTLWFEGPVLPLPDSQRQEDYPRDMAGEIRIAPDAVLGVRHGRLWTSEGAASGLKFQVGDLPEIVEQEIDGDPVPVAVQLPLTINGRIFPRENIDAWSFTARAGQTFTCEVHASRLGSPLDAHLEVRGPSGITLAENDDGPASDAFLRFTAPVDGTYQVRIRDVAFSGGPAHVYRLTLTADAHVDRVYPLGGRRGTKTRFEFNGQAVPKEPVEIALPAQGSDFYYRHPATPRAANPVLIDLDEVPEFLETEPNDTKAQFVSLPAMVNGRIDRAGDVDSWSFAAKKGDNLVFELRSRLLGSPLQGVLTLLDPADKELRNAEATGPKDPTLPFEVPADGTYVIRVADRFKGRGGPDFAYRLRIAPASKTPNFQLTLGLDSLTLLRDGKANLRINLERLNGFKEAINLELEGLPAGVKATNTLIPAGQNQVDVAFAADKTAPIGGFAINVRGKAKIDGKEAMRSAVFPMARGTSPVDSLLLGVALPCPFKITAIYDMRWGARGTFYRRRYRIDRNGFTGPIEIAPADKQARHLQGALGETVTIPPGQSDFDYAVYLPPFMETGRTCRVCIQGTAIVKDGTVDHTVSFSAINQNDQVITVVETGRLEITPEKSSVIVQPGATVTIPVQVSRGKGLQGAAKVELVLADHIRGVTADPLTIPADQSAGKLTLRFAAGPLGPFNMPALIRATVPDPTGPVIGESKFELAEIK